MLGNFLAGFGSFVYFYATNYKYGNYAGENWTGGERVESGGEGIRASIRPYADVRVIKEIGDAVIICAQGFRPLLESGILMLQAAKQLAHVAGDQTYRSP